MGRLLLIWSVMVLASCKSPDKPDPPDRNDRPDPKAPPDAEIVRLRVALEASETARNGLRLELMVVYFGKGWESFQGKKFDDRGFVEEILVRWEAVQRPLAETTSEQRRILGLLRGAVRGRYGGMPIPKDPRFEASRALVAALMSRHDTIRKTALEALDGIYGRTLMYRHDAPAEHRAEKHKRWVSEIHKLRR